MSVDLLPPPQPWIQAQVLPGRDHGHARGRSGLPREPLTNPTNGHVKSLQCLLRLLCLSSLDLGPPQTHVHLLAIQKNSPQCLAMCQGLSHTFLAQHLFCCFKSLGARSLHSLGSIQGHYDTDLKRHNLKTTPTSEPSLNVYPFPGETIFTQ